MGGQLKSGITSHCSTAHVTASAGGGAKRRTTASDETLLSQVGQEQTSTSPLP